MVRCPVCKTECGGHTSCSECGFSEVGRVFLNQEDARQWFDSVVFPFRNEYEKTTVLPALNWVEIFKQNQQAKALFEISIPVAQKKQEALGHIAIQSTNETVDKHFIEEIRKAVGQEVDIKAANINGLLKPGDFAAIVSSLMPGELVVFNVSGNIKKDLQEILPNAFRDFALDITIGKGTGARSIRLDLPPFTAILIVKKPNNIPNGLTESIGALIVSSFTKDELISYQIREIAEKHNVLLTRSALEVLVKRLKPVNVNSIIKFVADYLFLHPEIKQPMSSNELECILKTIG